MFQIIPICLFVEGGEKKSAEQSICLNRIYHQLCYCLLVTSKNFEKMFYFTNICFCSGKKLIDRIFEGLKLALLRICMIGMTGEGEGCISKDWDGVCCSYTGKNGAGGEVFSAICLFL